MWLTIFQRKKLSESECLVSIRITFISMKMWQIITQGVGVSWKSRLCINTAVVIPTERFCLFSHYLRIFLYMYGIYTKSAWIYVYVSSHTYTNTPTNRSVAGVMKHHIPSHSNSLVGRGALWEGGSGAVRGGAAKPDVDVLFAQAGQLRSQGLSRYICSRPQPKTNCLNEIEKAQWD